jgi:hypothetical protein
MPLKIIFFGGKCGYEGIAGESKGGARSAFTCSIAFNGLEGDTRRASPRHPPVIYIMDLKPARKPFIGSQFRTRPQLIQIMCLERV